MKFSLAFLRQAAFSCGLLRDVAQDDSSSRDLEIPTNSLKKLEKIGRTPGRVGQVMDPYIENSNRWCFMFHVDFEIKRFEVVRTNMKSGNGDNSCDGSLHEDGNDQCWCSFSDATG